MIKFYESGRNLLVDRPELKHERVRVYRNLRQKCWSIQHKGKVIAHCRQVMIEAARPVVSEAGRQRVLRERRKNVHAFIEGRLSMELGLRFGWEKLTYNPYESGQFVILAIGGAKDWVAGPSDLVWLPGQGGPKICVFGYDPVCFESEG